MAIRILDLFCGAGGCSVGYHRAFTAAGYDVEITGVDIAPQKHYPYRFIQADAMTFPLTPGKWDFVHASCPCQEFSVSRFLRDAVHPHATKWAKLLTPTYERLRSYVGVPWVIENVEPAPMPESVVLCGSMFGLPLRRHRRFSSNALLFAPRACLHTPGFVNVIGGKTRGYGDMRTTQLYQAGNGSMRRREKCLPKRIGQNAMGIDWMTLDEMSEAIPPVFTEFIGRQIVNVIESLEGRTA